MARTVSRRNGKTRRSKKIHSKRRRYRTNKYRFRVRGGKAAFNVETMTSINTNKSASPSREFTEIPELRRITRAPSIPISPRGIPSPTNTDLNMPQTAMDALNMF